MATPYSLDLRARILKDYDSGVPVEDLVVHYEVSRSWVKLFINLRSSCITDFVERGYTEKALERIQESEYRSKESEYRSSEIIITLQQQPHSQSYFYLISLLEQHNLRSHRPQMTQIDADVLSCQAKLSAKVGVICR